MRILAVTNMYPPHHYGGYELACQEVLDALRGRGHEVAVLTSTVRVPGVTAPDPPEAGVRRELVAYWRDHEIVRPGWRERLRIERGNQRALRAAVEALRPDVVSVWHMGALSFGLLESLRRWGLPATYVVCDDWLVYGPSVDAWLRPLVDHPWLGAAVGAATRLPSRLPRLDGGFCFASAHTRRAAEATGRWHLVPSTVSYLGVNTEQFPVRARPAEPWRGCLLHVGRIDPRKGIDVAIDALARLPAATLDIVGRGDVEHEQALRAAAVVAGVGDRVRWAVAERAELAARYADADAVLFPVRWDEPFGLVPLEAMACSTPVVATGTGGSGEYLRHERNCLLVPPGDAGALSAAVERLAGDPALRARVVDGGLRTAAMLTVDHLTDVLEAWHVAAAERFRRGVPPDRPPVGEDV